MTDERSPERQQALVHGQDGTTPWSVARERLANPEQPRTSWLATVQPDGRPHLMPVIAFWVEGALHILAGKGSRKARNLAAEPRCVVGMSSTTLPSLDIVAEGRAEAVTDEKDVRHVADLLAANNWPLEVQGDELFGPHAPTAGPPPYTIFRIVPSKVFGLPGMFGMDQFAPEDLPKATRWDFSGD